MDACHCKEHSRAAILRQAAAASAAGAGAGLGNVVSAIALGGAAASVTESAWLPLATSSL